jgi:hypothetical protein
VHQERVRQIIQVILRASEVDAKAELLAQAEHVHAAGSVTWVDLSVAPQAPMAPTSSDRVR